MSETRDFGSPDEGLRASLVTIADSSGIRAQVTDFGATLVALEVPDREGRAADVVLGFDRVEDYVANAAFYFGATIGRFGNRVSRGRFTLDGREYRLATNDAPGGIPSHLHGGPYGFHRRLWTIVDVQPNAVRFCYCSADGEEGYPGNLTIAVTCQVGPGRVLSWTAEATTDAPTIVNLVHHPYWNLSGSIEATTDRHILQLFADSYLPVAEGRIPTGEIRTVAGTPMDFRQPRPVGAVGVFDYDHCWVLNRQSRGDDLTLAARLSDPVSSRVLEISTNQPGIQFYDGKYLGGSAAGCTGSPYRQRAGLCLEPQNFPDAPNRADFPSCRLEPGEVYVSRVCYKFPVV